MPLKKLYKTRIAPTPSGYLHLGNVASFIITAGLARKHGAKILLRIDDLDRERVRPEYVQDIFDTLQFLGIPWDEGPEDFQEYEQSFSQVHRMPWYHEALRNLEESGAVFACECSRSQLAAADTEQGYPGTCISKKIPLSQPGASWRLFTQAARDISFQDLVVGERSQAFPVGMNYFQVKKKDGLPSYQLSSVVDDLYFNVNLVVRGADLFDSTLAQLFLSGLLPENEFGRTVFHHHTLLEHKGRKLSKSAGATSIRYLREAGHTAREVFSLVARGYGTDVSPDSWDELYSVVIENRQGQDQ